MYTLVLLPGMDGTGELFQEFITMYQGETFVVPLPSNTAQNYEALAEYIKRRVPTGKVVLLAESFSGGIVPHLLNLESQKIVGVVFVASFLSRPRKMLPLLQMIPIKSLLKFNFFLRIIHHLCLKKSPEHTRRTFTQVLKILPEPLIKQRVEVMTNTVAPSCQYSTPSIYILPKGDVLVPVSKSREIVRCFPDCKVFNIPGPHFILQTQAAECATIIKRFVQSLER